MSLSKNKIKFYSLSFLKHDLRSSVTVFFVALPLCLGISLASGTPVYSGLLAGIIGGIIVSLISGSQLSVSGPAAGLTAVSAAAILQMGSIEAFFISVAIAGIIQILLGAFRLGGFTHFIPSAVIKGMLSAIGIILISKQIPLFIGYDQPDFWTKELFNIFTFDHAYSHIDNLYHHTSAGVIIVSILSLIFLFAWKKFIPKKIAFVPASFATVIFGVLLTLLFQTQFVALAIQPGQFVSLPSGVFNHVSIPHAENIFGNYEIWKTAVVIAIIASLETLLSIEAIDKLDPYNRMTPQNRELIAQGTGNFISGLLGGIPITAVIVRSSANAEAGARTKLSGFAHGIWLLLAVLFCVPLVNRIPYCVLAVILIRTGYQLTKPAMIRGVFRQGREQFLPFMITVIAILCTDLLIGVLIGLAYSIYFIIKHTYRAGYTLTQTSEGHITHYHVELALNVSFLNKKRFMDMLDHIPAYSEVTIVGSDSVYIDNDILEIFQSYKSKAHHRHIQLTLKDIPEVQTIELHG
jgi:MFS superfamily sulfate permease-like transporter